MAKPNPITRGSVVITFLALLVLTVYGFLRIDHDGVPFPLFVFVGGLMGAGLNFIRDLHHHSDSGTETLSMLSSLLSRLLIGGALALAVYMLFLSGLLGGSLFPEFETLDYSKGLLKGAAPRLSSDFGKCMVWAFLAGYAEKFLPGLLAPTK